MSAARRRMFTARDQRELLRAIGECRQACVTAKTNADIYDPVYDACSGLMAAIDDVAAVLTGDRQYFWLKPHWSTPSKEPKN
jgi:hypothetical protein